ncbi:MAG: hypothetical protein R2828_08700 [Saprospiraceae bacterium]
MKKSNSSDTLSHIETLVHSFIAQTLPKEAWTHEAHLTVALWHLHVYSKDEAICFLRSRIITYNQVVGTENSPTSGYHETMTLFWIWIMDEFLKHNAGELETLMTRFLHSKYADRQLPLKFYSRAHLFSTKGRAIWIAPDLQALHFASI